MTLALTTASVATLALAPTAFAQQQNQSRMSWSQLTSQLENNGYQIRELDQKNDGWKAEVTDKNNRRLELRIDNQGKILREDIDD